MRLCCEWKKTLTPSLARSTLTWYVCVAKSLKNKQTNHKYRLATTASSRRVAQKPRATNSRASCSLMLAHTHTTKYYAMMMNHRQPVSATKSHAIYTALLIGIQKCFFLLFANASRGCCCCSSLFEFWRLRNSSLRIFCWVPVSLPPIQSDADDDDDETQRTQTPERLSSLLIYVHSSRDRQPPRV